MKRHKWIKDTKFQFRLVCERCGAIRWPTIGGLGKIYDPKTMIPKRWCDK